MAHLEREVVWQGHDNEIKIILKSCGSAVDLAASTKITLNFGGQTFISDNDTSSAMSWNKDGYALGELRIHIGKYSSLIPGIYDAQVVVYDLMSPSGIVWGDTLPLVINKSVETT